MVNNQWIKCISTEGNLRGVAVHATELVQSLAKRHGLKGLGARGLGEAVMGALLIASYCKPGQRINLNVRGTGLFKQALVDAYPEGTVRGYIIEQENQEKPTPDVGPWGSGLLSVLRTRDEELGKQPYIGTVPLLTGHLAKDLSFYWVQSEQIPSAVGLLVNIQDEKVISADGFLVQAMPGASLLEIQEIEKHLQELHSLGSFLEQEITPISLLSQIFQSTAFIVVEEKPISFQCRCSRERVERALALVGVAELQSMLSEDGKAVVRCDFCSAEYEMDGPHLEGLIQIYLAQAAKK